MLLWNRLNPKVACQAKGLLGEWPPQVSIDITWNALALVTEKETCMGFHFFVVCLFLVLEHWRRIDIKIRTMLEFSFNPLGYLEHTLRDALEAEVAETIFKSFFGILSINSAISVSRWQCVTQSWGKVHFPFCMNARPALTLRTDGFLNSKKRHL